MCVCVCVCIILKFLGAKQVCETLVGVRVRQRPVAVETEPVHSAAGAERQRVTCLVDDTSKCVGPRDTGQTVLRTMATMDKVG